MPELKTDPQERWSDTRAWFHETAEKICIPGKNEIKPKPWLSEDTKQLLEARRNLKSLPGIPNER